MGRTKEYLERLRYSYGDCDCHECSCGYKQEQFDQSNHVDRSIYDDETD